MPWGEGRLQRGDKAPGKRSRTDPPGSSRLIITPESASDGGSEGSYTSVFGSIPPWDSQLTKTGQRAFADSNNQTAHWVIMQKLISADGRVASGHHSALRFGKLFSDDVIGPLNERHKDNRITELRPVIA